MAKRRSKKNSPKQVEALTHDDAKRRNIPTAELQSTAERMEESKPFAPAVYSRASRLPEGERWERDEDLDPQIVWNGTTIRLSRDQIKTLEETGKLEIGEAQLVWRGKDQQDWSDLIVQAPPLYIQEKIHPKAIIESLKRQTKERGSAEDTLDLFEDFNGLDTEAKMEFYAHEQNWQNRMILGDSLQVMASLAEREALRGKVQCIYFDPPYGIKFNSNWQVSTRSRDVKDGKQDQITREPEQVKAFRDTWKDGIHSYLTHMRDRLTVMRDLLTDSGSIFVQIGDENVHRVRSLMDEVFGEASFVSEIAFVKTSGLGARFLSNRFDYLLWYARNKDHLKFRRPYLPKTHADGTASTYSWIRHPNGDYRGMTSQEKADPTTVQPGYDIYKPDNITSQGNPLVTFSFEGNSYTLRSKTTPSGLERLSKAQRIHKARNSIQYVRKLSDFGVVRVSELWTDTGTGSFTDDKIYVVQTGTKAVERCMLMTTDPGDLVLDPTCGSGSTAFVAEQWGRRWITTDTSRVALALARARLMGARYPYYYLADSKEGREKEQQVSGQIQPDTTVHADVRQGFVYERSPYITLGAIANNAEIDVIWESYQEQMEPIREQLNDVLNESWEEWEIPREASEDWSENAKERHTKWWELRIARQEQIDTSIAQKADVEYLYDRPYEDKSKVRVSGPFTVESLSPHRVISPGDSDFGISDQSASYDSTADFTSMVMENLKSSGVQQAAKEDRISFTTLEGWPGTYIAAEGRYQEADQERRAGIFIGPEFGSVTRSDIMAAAREANDARFDVLIVCGFSFDAHASEISKLGPLPILKAKMNPDLHMSDELKNTGAGNLFVVFGEPDIDWDFDKDGKIVVEVLGIDVFDPKTGEVRASGKDDIAAWFIDTDYDEESFFVRHAYFLGAQDPYKSLKTSLKAEIDEEAWATLYTDKSRPFARPESGRFAVKVINHFGDEVMKVFGVS